ncbi:hypothetical protein NLJ89_g4899 [Agrocybe chaxingu]|uniref:Uncharacterized protein n=1 Tax=Agrocybe chaxingu TaxID=84603 RepID=A0A9W8MVI2_9AGAR|nr:hypothetical protein NLJ89_g4899 [Agrocybe chaxingu]
MERLYIPIHIFVSFFKPVKLGCKAYDTIAKCIRFIRQLLKFLSTKLTRKASQQKDANPTSLRPAVDMKYDVDVSGRTNEGAVYKYAGWSRLYLPRQLYGAQTKPNQRRSEPLPKAETAIEPEFQPELTRSTKCVPVSGGEVIPMYHSAHAFLGLPEPYIHSSIGGNPAAARCSSILPNVMAAHSHLGLHTTLFSSPVATRSSISVNCKALVSGGGGYPNTQLISGSTSTPNLHNQPGVTQREMHTLVTRHQHHQTGRLSVPTGETRRSTEQGYSVSDSDDNDPDAIIHDENDDDDNRSYSQTAVISIHSPSTSTLQTTLGTGDDGPFLANPRITPVMPESTQRYSRRGAIPREHTNILISPLTVSFREPVAPPDWVKMVHPEGGRYYYHPEKHVYTDADLLDPRILAQVFEDLETIETFILGNNLSLPAGFHLVIDLYYELEEVKTTYFFVDHHTRSIFFLDLFEAQNLSGWYEAPGSTSQSHLRLEIEAQYCDALCWRYQKLLIQAMALLIQDSIFKLHFLVDVMTSPSSTTPFSADKLDKILSHTKMMEGNVGPGLAAIGNMSCLARYFYLFSHTKFIHFAGEPNARLDRNTSAYGEHMQRRTWLIKIASSLLFYGPDYYFQTIQSIWVDRICHKNEWDVVISKVNEEWKEVVIFSVILLNANGVFISIQDGYVSTVARNIGYLSVVASIGSLAAALLLTTKTRRNNLRAAEDVQSFLSANNNTRFGLEALSTICALPHALLTWGTDK